MIPTLGNTAYVEAALRSLDLARSNYGGAVQIVVSDASDASDAGAIAALAGRYGAEYVHGVRGAAVQRNAAVRVATHALLFFIDSDCEASSNLLGTIAARFEDPTVSALAGNVEFTGARSWVFDAVCATGVLDGFHGFGTAAHDVSWGVTAAFALRRGAWDSIGGFDATFPPEAGGEDVDLGLRLTAGGFRICYEPAALVFHPVGPWDGLLAITRRFFHYGKADVFLLDRHPQIRVRDGPGLLSGLLVFALAGVWRAVHAGSPLWLATGPVWLSTVIVAFALLTAGKLDRSIDETLALILLQALDAGRLWETLRQRKWRLLFSRVQLDDEQISRDWPAIYRTWLAVAYGSLLLVGFMLCR